MKLFTIFTTAFAFATASHAQTQYTSTAASAVEAARATALTLSPTSSIKGKTFDRFVSIWFENQDFDIAAADRLSSLPRNLLLKLMEKASLKWIASQGITLTNYKAITHPSQPNYVASVGGSQHWVWEDWTFRIDKSVKTIVDLLEPGGVSWSVYQQDMPYSGFEGNWVNQQNGANMYVRKHNPFMSYDSVTSNTERLAKCKNFTMFYSDLEADTLPQWMFITPNMTNNGHDTSVIAAGAFAKEFLTPLLSNQNFMKNTLVQLTFDESENYFNDNKVLTVLLGDVIPETLKGTVDDTAFNHYSILATVEKNWELSNLGLGDVGAAAFW